MKVSSIKVDGVTAKLTRKKAKLVIRPRALIKEGKTFSVRIGCSGRLTGCGKRMRPVTISSRPAG